MAIDADDAQPAGFRVVTLDAGIANDGRHDLAWVSSDVPCSYSAMFTRSRFAGPSVELSRSVADARGVVVASRNANVATGPDGLADARELRALVAQAAGLEPEQLLIASTGVIGRRYPMPAIRRRLQEPLPEPAGWAELATAIMTTDTRPKLVRARIGQASLVAVAKGVGMIEPNMATMLAFFCTDAQVDPVNLRRIFGDVVQTSFNALSIDSDTSTSDTAAIFANGLAGSVDLAEFSAALTAVALELVTLIARDGEGASKLITVRVTGARDLAQAKRVGKSVVNSPLVKTMAHGADPNWGRIVMAVGKCEDDLDIQQERVLVSICDRPVYPEAVSEDELAELRLELAGDTVPIGVDLGIGPSEFTVYGCDLSAGYVELNSSYTT